MSVSGSINEGVWGLRPQPPKANEGLGAKPPGAAAILQPFFLKKYVFLGIFWPKFLLKPRFLNFCAFLILNLF